eukprot:CAMPEP_0175994774 /NCGR_PEP_ID=MMETSP0108-20121206/54774_1 /TAXON_ID=195067 ORGANISM="Goniomonas pacifica, Strain CCMP1869" /NCGR_SAMPLE_ID=MMETSP0108 /ASSEMBLY_ACC=CAM_ASM_000204 /LENGTH=416 /DNA_ID=CAMNT_0017326845 /DNA_START=11 /DNA_END=1263 /DNA_ORIENTATION=-
MQQNGSTAPTQDPAPGGVLVLSWEKEGSKVESLGFVAHEDEKDQEPGNVVIDGQDRGAIAAGEQRETPLPPGDHSVEVNIPGIKEPAQSSFSLQPGEQKRFEIDMSVEDSVSLKPAAAVQLASVPRAAVTLQAPPHAFVYPAQGYQYPSPQMLHILRPFGPGGPPGYPSPHPWWGDSELNPRFPVRLEKNGNVQVLRPGSTEGFNPQQQPPQGGQQGQGQGQQQQQGQGQQGQGQQPPQQEGAPLPPPTYPFLPPGFHPRGMNWASAAPYPMERPDAYTRLDLQPYPTTMIAPVLRPDEEGGWPLGIGPVRHERRTADGKKLPKKPNRKLTLKRAVPRPWTDEDHQLFLRAMDEMGGPCWKAISYVSPAWPCSLRCSAKYFPNRTPEQLASHWQKHSARLERDRLRLLRTLGMPQY